MITEPDPDKPDPNDTGEDPTPKSTSFLRGVWRGITHKRAMNHDKWRLRLACGHEFTATQGCYANNEAVAPFDAKTHVAFFCTSCDPDKFRKQMRGEIMPDLPGDDWKEGQ